MAKKIKRIASKIFVDNKDKNIIVEYTNGDTGYFGFEKFDEYERKPSNKKKMRRIS
jgi:hypothetical protein